MPDLFFDLRSTHNTHRWFMPLTPEVCVGPPDNQFMFGGVGLAAAIESMERTCERPVVWATAQYLSYARPGSVVDLDVWVPAHGHNISQARVIGHVGDKEIFTVNAALGTRPMELSHQWARAPEVPAPADCPPTPHWRGQGENLHSRIEVRVAKGRYGIAPDEGLNEDGRLVLWIRPKGDLPIGRGMLAVMADFVPSGFANALGRGGGGNSLDNTIRYRQLVPTEWVLCDIQIHAVHAGFGHGSMHLFSESGELMATASQSVILRLR